MDQKDEEEGARGPRALRARSWLIIAPKAKRRDIRVVYPLIRWHPYLSNVEFVNSISVQPSIDCCTVLRKTAAKMIRLLYHDVLNFNDAYIYDFGVVLFFRGIKAVGGEGGGVALAVEEDGARRGRSKTLRSSRPSVRPSISFCAAALLAPERRSPDSRSSRVHCCKPPAAAAELSRH